MVIYTHYIEVFGFLVGLISAIAILRKDSKYLANIYLALANILISTYLICIFTYDIIQTLWSINIFLRIGMISLLFATLFIYYAMIIIMKSVQVFKETKMIYVNLVIGIAIAIYLIMTDFITQDEAHVGNVNIQIDIIPLAMMLVYLFYLTAISIYITFKFGINRISKGEKGYSKIRSFGVGLILFILTLFINVVSQITTNDVLGVIFDVLTFVIMVIGMLFISFSVLDFSALKRKKNTITPTTPSEE